MSILLFKTIIAVSEQGSFGAAADAVNLTQAAVGQQMKRLEETLNIKLFDRTEKTPRLNQLGKAFVPKAKDVVHAYDTILNDLTGDPKLIGELVLGAVPSTIRGLIPKSAKALTEIYPELHIRVIPDMSLNLLERIEQGTLDAAVMSEPSRISNHMQWLPFFNEELVLWTSSEVTLTDPLEILQTMPYIRHTRRAAVGMLADDWLSKNNIEVRDAMELGSLGNVASMVSHNLGVSVGPNICVPDPIFDGLNKLSLGETAPFRSLGILTRADCSKLQLIERFLDQVKAVVGEYSAENNRI